MTESELRTLPRKLAERMISETDNFGDCSLDIAIAKAEAVILEAIEQTLDAAEQAVKDNTEHFYDCDMDYMDGQPEPDKCQRCAIEAAIRSLKPAKPEETNGS